MSKRDCGRLDHYSIRKLTVGAASVLIGTTLFLGGQNAVVHADTASQDQTPISKDVNTSQSSPETKSADTASEAVNAGATGMKKNASVANAGLQGKTTTDSNSADGVNKDQQAQDGLIKQDQQTDTATGKSADSASKDSTHQANEPKKTDDTIQSATEDQSSKKENTEANADKNSTIFKLSQLNSKPDNKQLKESKVSGAEETIQGTAQQYVQGEKDDPDLSILSPDEARKLNLDTSSDAKITWVKAPDISKTGLTTGIAELTYIDYSAEQDASGNYPVKHINITVPVKVSAGQAKKDGQVRNTITYVDTDKNSIVRQFTWVGSKESDNNDLSDFATNHLNDVITKLGYEFAEGQDYIDFTNMRHFNDTDQHLVVFLKEIAQQPTIIENAEPYNDAATTHYITQTGKFFAGYDNQGNKIYVSQRKKLDKYIPDPVSLIGNLGILPAGTKISWKTAPQYDFTLVDDAGFANPLPTNDPVIEISELGQKPIELKFTDANKYLLSLPYQDPNSNPNPTWKQNITYNVGDTDDKLGNPQKLLDNYDDLLAAAESQWEMVNNRQMSSSEKDEFAKEFCDSWTWAIKPDLSQAGYTCAYVGFNPAESDKYYDALSGLGLSGSNYMTVLVQVIPKKETQPTQPSDQQPTQPTQATQGSTENPTPQPQPAPVPTPTPEPIPAPVHPEATPTPAPQVSQPQPQPTSANNVETVRPHAQKAVTPAEHQTKVVAPKSETRKNNAPRKAVAPSELHNAKARVDKPEIKQLASKKTPIKKLIAKQAKVTLPQTGEKKTNLTVMGLLGIAAALAILGLASDRKRN